MLNEEPGISFPQLMSSILSWYAVIYNCFVPISLQLINCQCSWFYFVIFIMTMILFIINHKKSRKNRLVIYKTWKWHSILGTWKRWRRYYLGTGGGGCIKRAEGEHTRTRTEDLIWGDERESRVRVESTVSQVHYFFLILLY